MSCIAGMELDGVVAIAAETQGGWGNLRLRGPEHKLVKFGGCVFGFTGLRITGQHFERFIKSTYERPRNGADIADLLSEFVRWQVNSLDYDAHVSARKDDSGFPGVEGNILVASPTGIWVVGLSLSVDLEPFWAIGSGDQLAIGYMQCAKELFDDGLTEDWSTASRIVQGAVRCATIFDKSCGGEIDVETVELNR